MRSTFGGLNTMVLGLYAQQTGLDTVGHNISNANTAGYSRQLVALSATNPQTIYANGNSYQIGTGVNVQSVTRARNTFIDKQMWQETSTLNYAQNSETYLAKIESVFGEPTDTGMQSVMNSFWDSWQTLSTNASDDGTRTTVRERGVELVNTIQLAYTQLTDTVSDINSVIALKVDKINQITSELSGLNKQIFNVEAGGTDHANDLRDKRDYLVDQLSAMVDVRVTENSNGCYTIQSASTTLVNNDNWVKLEAKPPTSPTDADYGYEVNQVYAEGDSRPLAFTNGEIKGLLDMRDSDKPDPAGIKYYLNSISNISQFLLQDFNAVHRSGYGTDNSTHNNFFGDPNIDYSDTSAVGGFKKQDWIKALQVSSALLQDGGTAKIAAKSTGSSIGVTQSNTAGSKATIFASGTYTLGATPTSLKVRVASTDGTGNIDSIEYSLDGGGNWSSSPISVNADGYSTFTANGLKVDMYFGNDTDNNYHDTYSFSLDKNSADSKITTTQSNTGGGAASVAIQPNCTYSNGDIATSVIVQAFDSTATNFDSATGQVKGIKYSTDGGTTWSTTPVSINKGTFSFTVSGITLSMTIGTTTNNKSTDQYYFTLSKGNVASGDNAVLLGKALKTDTSGTLGSKSLDGYYSSLIGTLGVQSESAQSTVDNQQTMVDQINNWRESVAGVNMDEEMTHMIQYQKGYNAAARVLTAMDEMLDKLINGTGVVGR